MSFLPGMRPVPFVAASGVVASISPVDFDFSLSDLTSYTFTVSFGASPDPGEKRSILVCYGAVRNGSCSFTSATIDGGAATSIAGDVAIESTLEMPYGIIAVDDDTGTSGDVVLNFSGAPAAVAISVHRMINGSLSATDTATDNSATTTATLTHDCVANSVSLACVINRDGSAYTWSGLSEDYDFEYNGGGSDEWFSSASQENAAAATKTITATVSTNPVPFGGCSASFPPSLT